MRGLSDIVTVSLGVAALLTLVYAKDPPSPTPGVRTAIELFGNRTAGGRDITMHGGLASVSARVIDGHDEIISSKRKRHAPTDQLSLSLETIRSPYQATFFLSANSKD
jgi:hypothetical protein